MIRLPILRAGSDDEFPALEFAMREPNGLLAAGADLGTPRLLNAYQQGIFPWYSTGQPILWWSPDPRMVFRTDRIHVPRRLARWLRRCAWTLHADRDFAAVIDACAAPRDEDGGTWITAELRSAFLRLHAQGYAHSIEVRDQDELIGGLYGMAIGKMFFAESMFSRRDNASKLALLGLADLLAGWSWPLIDAQVSSAHLHSLGGVEMPRREFSANLCRLTELHGKPGVWRDTAVFRAAPDLIGERS